MTQELPRERRLAHIDYKWIALSNTTLGVLMASLNGTIMLITLPAIFRGIGVNPLAPGETNYLLWVLLGYMVVTATLLVTAGRISDMYGRVRLYNAGFAVFTVGSILLFFVQGQGNVAAIQLIAFRIIQGIGGAFLFANSTAILTDAFPPDQRGMAMGINQVAGIGGGFLGLILGGVLAAIDWRAVFLVSVPLGALGTIWAYLVLHEVATIREHQRIDIWGNLLFAGGLTMLLIGLTYGIEPYGGATMGWTSPFVIGMSLAGLLLLGAFVVVERHVPDPMFHLELFRIRMFAAGNAAGFLSSVARGGLQFLLIIWLQGIWLPLHGYNFQDTPLWAGIYMLPMTVGFLVMGPLSGYLSDRYGARGFATAGMLITAVAFVGMMLLPANFNLLAFVLLLILFGIGMGTFAAPNTTAIMNSVPAEHRGAASGMRATFQNVASTLSITVIFSLVTLGLAANLPGALFSQLSGAGIPAAVALQVSHLPPIGALFAAFLGYNPMGTLLPPDVLAALPQASRALVLGKSFFPNLIAGPFMDGLRIAFALSVVLSVLAAIASLLRGPRFIYELEVEPPPAPVPAGSAQTLGPAGSSLQPAHVAEDEEGPWRLGAPK
jgi:EmrB/QacA subfamily drug resistance transporter